MVLCTAKTSRGNSEILLRGEPVYVHRRMCKLTYICRHSGFFVRICDLLANRIVRATLISESGPWSRVSVLKSPGEHININALLKYLGSYPGIVCHHMRWADLSGGGTKRGMVLLAN